MLRIFTIFLIILLSACNQNENETTPQDNDNIIIEPITGDYPVVLAGDDQFAPPNTIITLSGYTINTVGILWMQVQGTPAEIEAPAELVTNVTIPDVDQSEVLIFRIVGIDENGLYIHFDEMQIEIVI